MTFALVSFIQNWNIAFRWKPVYPRHWNDDWYQEHHLLDMVEGLLVFHHSCCSLCVYTMQTIENIFLNNNNNILIIIGMFALDITSTASYPAGHFCLVSEHIHCSYIWLSGISAVGHCSGLVYDCLLPHVDPNCGCLEDNKCQWKLVAGRTGTSCVCVWNWGCNSTPI